MCAQAHSHVRLHAHVLCACQLQKTNSSHLEQPSPCLPSLWAGLPFLFCLSLLLSLRPLNAVSHYSAFLCSVFLLGSQSHCHQHPYPQGAAPPSWDSNTAYRQPRVPRVWLLSASLHVLLALPTGGSWQPHSVTSFSSCPCPLSFLNK